MRTLKHGKFSIAPLFFSFRLDGLFFYGHNVINQDIYLGSFSKIRNKDVPS